MGLLSGRVDRGCLEERCGTMSGLASLRETCTPRADVLAGGLVDRHFAAQLDQVMGGAAGYEAYADAERFFELTFPTAGLRLPFGGRPSRIILAGAGPAVRRVCATGRLVCLRRVQV